MSTIGSNGFASRQFTILLFFACLVLSVEADTCTTWYDEVGHGKAFRNVKDYGAKGDGITDDTTSIQRAIDEGRGGEGDLAKSPGIVYVPPGSYVVSDTIVLWYWTHFRGSATCPPTIVLKPASPGFNDPRGFKPIIATAAGYNVSTNDSWWKGDIDANCNFYTQLHNIKVQIGKGNTGATGVIWRVAQQTSIRNLTVDATEGSVGLDIGSPPGYSQFGGLTQGGGGTVENVVIKGGKYGIRGLASQWLLRNIRIRGATVACMQLSPWIFSLLSVHMSDCPVGLEVNGARNLVVLDSTFTNISNGTAIVTDRNPLILDRVTVSGATFVVDRVLPADAAKGSTTSIRSWRQGPANLSYVHGLNSTAATGGNATCGHLPPQRSDVPVPTWGRPAFDSAVSVAKFGAKGDGIADDTKAIQAAIDSADTVFLPYGIYMVSRIKCSQWYSRVSRMIQVQSVVQQGEQSVVQQGE
jgi:hypothetical protein